MTKQDANEEQLLRTDLEYALEKLGIADIPKAIESLTKRLDSYGFEYTTDEVINMLKEI